MADKLYLSASRIKTLQSCSWLYYCNYVLKLPSSTNSGASRGSVAHIVLECLLRYNKRSFPHGCLRKDLVAKIRNKPFESESIYNLALKHARKLGVADAENMTLIQKFIEVALNNNFYLDHLEVQEPEYEFTYGDKDVEGYSIRGFIDKYGICHESKKIEIWDYKTSKAKFTGDDLTNNLQALMYSLVMRKKHPDYASSVKFLFLKFPRSPLQELEFNPYKIDGFEEFLRNTYSILSDFDYEKAKSNLAGSNKEYSWLCGRNVDYPGQLKEDGTPKWCCPHRFPTTYYAQVDEKGNNITTAYNKEELSEKNGEIVTKKYAGCPHFFS